MKNNWKHHLVIIRVTQPCVCWNPCQTSQVNSPHLHIWLLHGHHVEVSPPKVGKVPPVPAKAPCHHISPNGISNLLPNFTFKKAAKTTHFMIHDRYTTAKCNVFLEFSHKSQSCWVFGGFTKCRPFDLPKNLGKMLPPSPHQLRAAYKAAQRFQEQILSPLLDPRINISLDLPNGWQVCVLNAGIFRYSVSFYWNFFGASEVLGPQKTAFVKKHDIFFFKG